MATSNPIKIPPGRRNKSGNAGDVRITSEHMRNLKHDMEFIKKASELRDVGDGKGKPGANPKAPAPRQSALY